MQLERRAAVLLELHHFALVEPHHELAGGHHDLATRRRLDAHDVTCPGVARDGDGEQHGKPAHAAILTHD